MQHRAPRPPRTVIATSVLALVVGAGGVVGGLSTTEESTPAAVGVQVPDLDEVAHTRWLDGQYASRQARSGWSGSTTSTPARRAQQSTSTPTTSSPSPSWSAGSSTSPAPAPSTTAPSTTAPSTTAPGTTAPSTTAPGATAPSAATPTTAPSTTPAPAPAPTAPAGGQQGTGATGYAAFDSVEEFTTPVARGQWPGDGRGPSAYPRYLSYVDGTSGKYYPSDVLSVHDGVLDWYCHDSKAAAVLPFGYEGFTYGTYTVRMRTENFPQYHIAFLLWPVTDQWTHELDGPEGETTDTHPYPAVLQSGPQNPTFNPNGSKKVPESWNDAGFHDYTWQWTKDQVRFYQDGVLVSTATGNIPNQAMRPVLQVEWSNRLGSAQPDPSITGHVYVDAVMYDADPNIAVPVV